MTNLDAFITHVVDQDRCTFSPERAERVFRALYDHGVAIGGDLARGNIERNGSDEIAGLVRQLVRGL